MSKIGWEKMKMHPHISDCQPQGRVSMLIQDWEIAWMNILLQYTCIAYQSYM